MLLRDLKSNYLFSLFNPITKYAPIRIRIEPIACVRMICSPSHTTAKIREITGDISRIVAAFDRLMYFSPQYHVRT